ncbi:alpha/beta hydrolase [Puniceibacterium sp. IMCC21224]|uniref:alpha/beta hydrolase n=1 Tax=Puniceibacterium sp. IMCC21224 TaxID=1618204 RepID=UPI00065D47F7|nr:alpha/beta hydrolase-fold protein [Puniceibacterium sp. IMCC21224]KMK67000.1 putative hydrolase of alpha/beta superfamily [Puniceibacterium sp. IMCC21224]
MPTPADIRHAPAQTDLWQGPHPTHDLSQRILPRSDATDLRLFIARPLRPEGPVLYMLDGGALPPLLVPDLLARHPGVAVIAVGYDTPRAFSPVDRYRDYTPTLLPDETANLNYATGNARVFSTLLTGDLRQSAEAGLEIDPTRRSLWGHSVGGLFTLTQLLTAPEQFAGYVPASPSVWAAEATITALAIAAPPLGRRQLLCTMGDNESRSGAPPLQRPAPAPATLRLLDRLEQRGDLTMRQTVFPGAQHGPALALSLPHALEAATRI